MGDTTNLVNKLIRHIQHGTKLELSIREEIVLGLQEHLGKVFAPEQFMIYIFPYNSTKEKNMNDLIVELCADTDKGILRQYDMYKVEDYIRKLYGLKQGMVSTTNFYQIIYGSISDKKLDLMLTLNKINGFY